ncbi:MAG TPA: hypothetical protein PKZ84_04690 [Anaerolineae bacterium]|nr:hypothetical protein [Anaerolineae bacterium]HQI83866.1 hypothetical protein [Anaerolineae bacterium]
MNNTTLTDAETMTVELSPQVGSVLGGITGETLNQKIAYLLQNEVRRNLEACERDQLEFEIKHGLEYEAFIERLEAGELGDEFAYSLEMDALRWGDLVAEKKHWLQQLNVLRESFE